MLASLIEAALRSLILGFVVWLGLRIFRVHNVIAQRSTWIAVLAGSLLMPFVLPFTSHWHHLSFATIPVPVSLQHMQPAVSSPLPSRSYAVLSAGSANAPADKQFRTPSAASHSILRLTSSTDSEDRVLELNSPPAAIPDLRLGIFRPPISITRLSVLTYFLVTTALFLRLLFGLLSAMYLWHNSTPIPPVSDVPFGADLFLRWNRKISAPVTVASGIVLPAGYKSWPSEKIRIVLAHERSHVRQRDFYLQILASLYSAVTWFSPLGWWLKHKLSDLSEAISDRSGLNEASDRSAYAEVLLEFAAAPRPTLIGVAMARPSNVSRRIERLLNDSYFSSAFSGSVRARIAVLVAPALLIPGAAVVHVQASAQPNPASQSPVSVSAFLFAPPAASLPAKSPVRATLHSAAAPVELALAIPPAVPEPGTASQSGAAQTENSFDRNLTVNGKLELSVATGSGNISLTRGPANQVHIHGIVKAGNDADPAQVEQIVANPPIEQAGSSIRIGGHQENLHNISISYEIEAPADAELNVATGSGNINDTGVGHDARLITGSGNITATGLQGDFRTQTGSGNISIDSMGQVDAKAQTGSGNIDLNGVHGTLQAQTGSGRIKAEGTPSSPWQLRAGSGSIELSTGNAPINLDASTGSGHITTNQALPADTSSGRHNHVHAPLNGGGPEVLVETGSGDIHID